MKIFSSRCNTASAAGMLIAITTLSWHGNLQLASAFAPSPIASSQYSRSNIKGSESFLHSSTAISERPATKSKTVKSSKKRSQKKGKNKIVRPRVVVKNAPKGTKRKGKGNSSNTKSFKPLKDLKLGSKISGKVVDVCDFGAFVSIGYNTRGSRSGTALLHVSQIQDKKINNIHDVLKVGDDIKGARVISVDLRKGEVGLGMRTQRPKRRDFAKLKVGDELEGKVASVVSYGAFIDVGANVNGLLHISRVTGGAIENIRHHLNEGDPVSVHVIDLDRERKTLAVSMLDKKADQYLDRRMSQRLKRFYGTSNTKSTTEEENGKGSDLDYFDQAIKELEDALRDRDD